MKSQEDTHVKLDEALLLLKTLSEIKSTGDEGHQKEHEYLRALIEEHKVRKVRNSAIIKTLASGTLWSILVGIFSSIVYSLKGWLGN